MAKCLCKCSPLQKGVWTLEYPEPGVNWEIWNEEQDAPHGPIADIFVGNGGLWGTGDHVNGAPNVSGVTDDFNFNDSQLLGDADEARQKEQIRVWGWKEIPEDGFIRDNNGNTGETGRFYCGLPDDCCNNSLYLLADRDTSTNGGDRVLFGPTPVVAGIYPAVVLMSDLSFFGGLDLEFSVDGVDGWTNLTGGYPSRPQWTCRLEPICYELLEDEFLKPDLPCCPDPFYVAP